MAASSALVQRPQPARVTPGGGARPPWAALQVLDASTVQGRRRAHHEADMMWRLQGGQAAPVRPSAPTASASGAQAPSDAGKGGGCAGASTSGSASTTATAATSPSTSGRRGSCHVMRLLEWFQVDSGNQAQVCLVLEPLHQTAAAVLHYLGQRERRGLPAPAVRNFARQLLLALDDMHSQGLCHRDVKPHNVLLAAPFFVESSSRRAGARQVGSCLATACPAAAPGVAAAPCTPAAWTHPSAARTTRAPREPSRPGSTAADARPGPLLLPGRRRACAPCRWQRSAAPPGSWRTWAMPPRW